MLHAELLSVGSSDFLKYLLISEALQRKMLGGMSLKKGKTLDCCCCSVTQLCPILCGPMDWRTPGLSLPHHVLVFAHVFRQKNGGMDLL